MRRGGRLPGRLTTRDLAGRMKLTFAIHRDSLAITRVYVLQLPNCIKASREATLRGEPCMHELAMIIQLTRAGRVKGKNQTQLL